MKKELFKYMVILCAALAMTFVKTNSTRATDYSGLMINLYVSDERILIYAGMDRGLFGGQRFNVFRDGRNIGTISLVDVRTSSSIAKTITKTFNFQDMDLLSPADGTTVVPSWRKPYEGSEGSVTLSDPSGMTQRSPSGTTATSDSTTQTTVTPELSKKKKIDVTDAAGDAPATAPASKTSSDKKPSTKTDTKATTKTESKKEDAKEDKASTTKKSSSRGSSRSSSKESTTAEKSDDAEKKSDTAKDDAKEEKPAAKKSSRSRGSSSTASKSDDKKTDSDKKDSKPTTPAKPTDPRDFSYATNQGYSGLWSIPTSDVIGKNRSSFSYYHSWRTMNASTTTIYPGIKTVSSGYGLDLRASEYSFTYGVARNVEVSLSRIKISAEMRVNNATGWGDMEGHTIGIKYNHGMRRHFLEPTTAKKWSYALGGHITELEGTDSTLMYGMVSIPTEKFDVHGGLFFSNYNGMVGKRWGTMAGVEVPISPRAIFIGEGQLFQSDYTFNVATRYIYKKRNSILLGIADITEDRIKSMGFSFVY